MPSHRSTHPDADPDADPDLVDAVVQTAFTVVAVLAPVAAEHDLSLTQLRVLAILSDRRVRMSELAAYLGLDRSTMSGLVDRAERRGLMVRTPARDDKRAVEVTLSAAGRALTDQVRDRIRLDLAPLTDRLTPADRRRLQDLLERMIAVG